MLKLSDAFKTDSVAESKTLNKNDTKSFFSQYRLKFMGKSSANQN